MACHRRSLHGGLARQNQRILSNPVQECRDDVDEIVGTLVVRQIAGGLDDGRVGRGTRGAEGTQVGEGGEVRVRAPDQERRVGERRPAAAKAAADKHKGIVDALKKFGSCAGKEVADQAKTAVGLATSAYALRPLIPGWPQGASGFIRMTGAEAGAIETDLGVMDIGGEALAGVIAGAPWAITAIGGAALVDAGYCLQVHLPEWRWRRRWR